MNLKWLLRDFLHNPIFFIIIILNFSLGLAGFVSLDLFKTSIQNSLSENAKEFLSADFAVSARRELNEKELNIVRQEIGQVKIEGQVKELFTMVASKGGSRLVQLKAIDSAYPIYGKMILSSNVEVRGGSEKEICNQKRIWVYPELLVQLNVKVGDTVKIGREDFLISNTILEDSTQTFRLASIAPKVYMGLNFLPETGLIRFGTTLSDAHLFKVPETSDLIEIKKRLFEKIEDPGIQFQTSSDAQEDSGRTLGYLSDYLGLVSLVGLFLSFIGGAFLYRSFLSVRVKSIATLNTLGLDFNSAFYLFTFQFIVLAVLSGVISIGLSFLISPTIASLVSEFSVMQINLKFQTSTLIVALLSAAFGCMLISLPFLMSIKRINLSLLLQDSTKLDLPFRRSDSLYFLPLLAFFYGLSLWQSHSFKVGSIFFVSLILSVLVIAGLALLLFFLLAKLFRNGGWITKHGIFYIQRKKAQSIPIILALSLCSLLINLIPQLKAGLEEEFSFSKKSSLPTLFLFDIQDDQIEKLRSQMAKREVQLDNPSPLIRARIVAVNGNPFEKKIQPGIVFKTREEEIEARFRNRGFNLSYRDTLRSSEKITAGAFNSNYFKGGPGEIAEISIEERFAKRLNFNIGDILKFDVQGVEVEGKITNFRSVKWNSFQPNFFVLFQRGVFEEAPKTWLASIGNLAEKDKDLVQAEIVESFPNISILDIKRTVQKVIEQINKMTGALQFMGFLSLLVGLIVVYSISYQQAASRQWDMNMLKILGASKKDLILQAVTEFSILSLFAGFLGALLSVAVTFGLSYYIFEGIYKIDFISTIVVAAILLGSTILTSIIASYRVFNANPASLLS